MRLGRKTCHGLRLGLGIGLGFCLGFLFGNHCLGLGFGLRLVPMVCRFLIIF